MLTPKQLQEIAEQMQPVLDELNNWIVRDIVKRVMARLRNYHQLEITPTSEWQAQVMIDAGGHLEDLHRELVTYTRKSNEEVRRIFQEAGLEAYEADAEVMRQQGVDVPPLRHSPTIQKILEDTYQRTQGELHNYTRTTAVKSQQELFKALDLAHIKVMSGATSYNEAVRETIMDLAEHQAQVVYPTGHVDTLEVAVLRAVRTGTAQASGNMTMGLMEKYQWDIVLTSAHLGARYGDGGENPGNHAWWQGRFFSVSGKDERFPSFYEATGYGTGEGLCGWNCRHSFGPGDGEHNPWKQYDAEENKKAYDLSQAQRKQERDIRKQKRKVMALKEAIDSCTDPEMKRTLQDAYNSEYDKLGNMNARYNSFCDENGVPRLADRLQVAEWNYKEAMQLYKKGNSQDSSKEKTSSEMEGIIKLGTTGRFVNSNEKLYRYAEKVKEEPGYQDFFSHATPSDFIIYTKATQEGYPDGNEIHYSPKEFAEMIRNSPAYKGGDIRLLCCQSGQDDEGAAQQVADILGVKIKAPTEIVNLNEDGGIFLSNSDILADLWYNGIEVKESGHWRTFYPREGSPE